MNLKNPLKGMVKMMEYVDNKEEVTVEEFSSRFSEADYKKFEKYCMGGEVQGRVPLYASGPVSPHPTEKISLTTEGVRKLYELKKTVAAENLATGQRNINLIIAFTGSALASFGALNAFELLVGIPKDTMPLRWFLGGLVFLIFIVSMTLIALTYRDMVKLSSKRDL